MLSPTCAHANAMLDPLSFAPPPLLSFPLSPLLLGRVTLGDRTLLPRIIMPSSSSLASAPPPLVHHCGRQSSQGIPWGKSHTHTHHTKLPEVGGMLEILFLHRFSTIVSCCYLSNLQCPTIYLGPKIECKWEGVNHLQ